MGLKDCIKRDIERVFLNTSDFCDNITIQIGPNSKKFNIIGSLQNNSIENNSGNSNPLQSISYTLYIKYPLQDSFDKSLLSSGARITIDNKSFTAVSVADEMGIATIELTTYGGR